MSKENAVSDSDDQELSEELKACNNTQLCEVMKLFIQLSQAKAEEKLVLDDAIDTHIIPEMIRRLTKDKK